ncbi:ComF family protein [Gulbenkiania mobilis]|uniref:ComF family protein n=2 Tax=Gulbenkiania mobilis TaxID=397457 RepID=A0ABY2D1X4_GULMO|nr:ComF family protein [Gulbenkiania mobilis]
MAPDREKGCAIHIYIKSRRHRAVKGFLLSNIAGIVVDKCSFFEQICVLCKSSPAPGGLCPACLDMLPRHPQNRCRHCAQPMPAPGVCGHCQRHPPSFDALHVSWQFGYPLSGLIHAFKYGKRLELAGVLSRLIVPPVCEKGFKIDWIFPVPLSKERLAERGFNQSEELARALAGTMQIRFSANICWRKRNTPFQAQLERAERYRNVKDAFGVKRRLDGLDVLLVDDVATTGATLSALAEAVKKQGARRVEAWVLARA